MRIVQHGWRPKSFQSLHTKYNTKTHTSLVMKAFCCGRRNLQLNHIYFLYYYFSFSFFTLSSLFYMLSSLSSFLYAIMVLELCFIFSNILYSISLYLWSFQTPLSLGERCAQVYRMKSISQGFGKGALKNGSVTDYVNDIEPVKSMLPIEREGH